MEPRRFLIGNRKMANLNELSLTQALTGLKNREFSSTELTTACLNRIKKLDDNAKVVMVSAMGQETLVREAIMSGAKSFIVKPYKEDHIVQTLNSIAAQ